MTVLETLLGGIRTHEGALLAARLAPGEEYVVPVGSPLVLCGVVAGGVTVAGEHLSPGGTAMIQPGAAVAVRAGDAGAALLVCGYSSRDGGIRLTSALPAVAVAPTDDPDCVTLLELLDRGGGGPPVVRDRLLDWLLTCTLTAWFERRAPEPPGWFAALADPVVGPALEALHADPAHRWTVEELAARGGVGRAAFAKRFREARRLRAARLPAQLADDPRRRVPRGPRGHGGGGGPPGRVLRRLHLQRGVQAGAGVAPSTVRA